jgi:hypothetical protein
LLLLLGKSQIWGQARSQKASSRQQANNDFFHDSPISIEPQTGTTIRYQTTQGSKTLNRNLLGYTPMDCRQRATPPSGYASPQICFPIEPHLLLPT